VQSASHEDLRRGRHGPCRRPLPRFRSGLKPAASHTLPQFPGISGNLCAAEGNSSVPRAPGRQRPGWPGASGRLGCCALQSHFVLHTWIVDDRVMSAVHRLGRAASGPQRRWHRPQRVAWPKGLRRFDAQTSGDLGCAKPPKTGQGGFVTDHLGAGEAPRSKSRLTQSGAIAGQAVFPGAEPEEDEGAGCDSAPPGSRRRGHGSRTCLPGVLIWSQENARQDGVEPGLASLVPNRLQCI